MRLNVPYFNQEKSTTCGPACLRMVLAFYNIKITEDELEELCETSWLGNTCEEIFAGANKLGFKGEIIENMDYNCLKRFIEKQIPVIVLIDPAVIYGGIKGFGHFVTVIGAHKKKIYYHDPDLGKELEEDKDVFLKAWSVFSYKGVIIWKSTKK